MSKRGKKRVLFFCEGWGTGGIEAVVLSIVRSQAFKSCGYKFEIFCACDWDTAFDEEVRRLGGVRNAVISGSRASIWSKYRLVPTEFKRYLAENQFDIAHINVTNRLACLYASIAKHAGVPRVIIHSHNSGFDEKNTFPIAKSIGNALGTAFVDAADERIACSAEAGRFLYGNRSARIVRNGVEAARFSFDPISRAAIREVLGIDEGITLLGNVGNIENRKNPLFQLDVFAAVQKMIPDASYLMVGAGSMRSEVEEHARDLGISEKLVIAPPIDRPEWYYSALDLLLFPSFEEGFGLVALEAQCAGLPVLASTAVPFEVDASDLVVHLDLDEPVGVWANEAVDLLKENGNKEKSTAWKSVEEECGSERMAQQIIDAWEGEPVSWPARKHQAHRQRILTTGMSNNRGGTEAVIANIAGLLAGETEFDFLCFEHLSNYEQILENGNREIILPNKRTSPIAYYKAINEFFENHADEYDAVWSNLNILNNIDALRLGAKHGIRRRILHSHNSRQDGKPHQRILSAIHKGSVSKYVTEYWACSRFAGDFMFPGENYTVVPNSIDLEAFAFSANERKNVRKELGIAENAFVIGNIGRLAEQKNQVFLLNLMPQLLERRADAVLVIVGDGELKRKLEKRVQVLGIQDHVVFAGQRSDARACYSAFDSYAFPSLFEGMPVALIEAQANGLSCVVSNCVSPDAAISHTVSFLPLEQAAWVSALADAKRIPYALDEEKAARFDNKKQAVLLKELFS